MTEHDFILVLPGVSELTTELEDRLFEAGCDDATLALQGGVALLDFTRSARTRTEAVASAIRDVRAAGIPDVRELAHEAA